MMCSESSFPRCIRTWVEWLSQVPGLGNVLQSVKSGDSRLGSQTVFRKSPARRAESHGGSVCE